MHASEISLQTAGIYIVTYWSCCLSRVSPFCVLPEPSAIHDDACTDAPVSTSTSPTVCPTGERGWLAAATRIPSTSSKLSSDWPQKGGTGGRSHVGACAREAPGRSGLCYSLRDVERLVSLVCAKQVSTQVKAEVKTWVTQPVGSCPSLTTVACY